MLSCDLMMATAEFLHQIRKGKQEAQSKIKEYMQTCKDVQILVKRNDKNMENIGINKILSQQVLLNIFYFLYLGSY